MKCSYQILPINQLQLDLQNPRISQYLEMFGDNVTAEGIALALNDSGSSSTSTSFNSLRESIRVNKGIINPIIVNHISQDDLYIVIEGNTRLQIYKDFFERTMEETWDKIRCLVYEDLTKLEIDAIRLQSHLVGPRDWDPYSKAQYLNKLYHKDGLSLNTIIDYCGGKKGEILKLIDAYNDMQTYYIPLLEGDKPDVREFSKFSELQNRRIKNALNISGYSEKDFAEWVYERHVDTAQNVRWLPEILTDEAAKKEFLKSNISNAITKLHTANKEVINLKDFPYDELCRALITKLRNIPYEELKGLRKCENEEMLRKKNYLGDLSSELKSLWEDIDIE